MKIRRKDTRHEVDDKRLYEYRGEGDGWCQYDAHSKIVTYYSKDDWEPVPEPIERDVTSECEVRYRGHTLYHDDVRVGMLYEHACQEGYRLEQVTCYEVPEDIQMCANDVLIKAYDGNHLIWSGSSCPAVTRLKLVKREEG